MTDLDRLLDFAQRSRLPEGGFGYLGDDGLVLAGRPVETWIVARMTHVFGLAHLLGRPGADELVRHGVVALTDGPLRDAQHGGWRASTEDDTKAAYPHAFVLLAGGAAPPAAAAGGAGAVGGAAGGRGGGRPPPPPASRAARSCWGTRWASGRRGSGTTTPGWPSRSGTPRGAGSTTTAASTPTCTASRRRWPPPTRCPWPTRAARRGSDGRRCVPPNA